jgi:hypothetical protein
MRYDIAKEIGVDPTTISRLAMVTIFVNPNPPFACSQKDKPVKDRNRSI